MRAGRLPAEEKLEALTAERAEVAAQRTREDIKAINERSLANAYARLNGSSPSHFFLNETATPEHLEAVIAEFQVETKGPSLLEHIVANNTPEDALSDRQKKQRLSKLDAEIAELKAEVKKHAKAAALAEVEREFAGEAA